MRCPTCSGPMTPMLFSWFCPRDCDKPKEEAPRMKRTTTPGIGGPLMLQRKQKPWDLQPGGPSAGNAIVSIDGTLYTNDATSGKRYRWVPTDNGGYWLEETK